MTETNEKFLRNYEKLRQEVNLRAGRPDSHSFEIEEAVRRDGAVRRQRELLKYIRDIRHFLQHPQHRSAGAAAIISSSFEEEVAALLEHFVNSPTAMSLGVPRKRIKTAQLSDRLGDLADDMKSGGFSHVPILDTDDVLVGVFNEAAVFDYLWSENEKIVGRSMLVQEILPHCRLDANHTETFRFVSPRVPLEDLVDMFLALQSPTTRVGAVFVTASGKSTEKLQRLITPWDVLGGGAE